MRTPTPELIDAVRETHEPEHREHVNGRGVRTGWRLLAWVAAIGVIGAIIWRLTSQLSR